VAEASARDLLDDPLVKGPLLSAASGPLVRRVATALRVGTGSTPWRPVVSSEAATA